jgi:hypothetical protein
MVLQSCLNKAGIVRPHYNSDDAWDRFCNALAEKFSFMEQALTHFQTSPASKHIYQEKKRSGVGLDAWKHAFQLHKTRLIQLGQYVLKLNK